MVSLVPRDEARLIVVPSGIVAPQSSTSVTTMLALSRPSAVTCVKLFRTDTSDHSEFSKPGVQPVQGVGVRVAVGVLLGVSVIVGVGVMVGVFDSVGVTVTVAVWVMVGVRVLVAVTVRVLVGVAVRDAVADGELVDVKVGVELGVTVKAGVSHLRINGRWAQALGVNDRGDKLTPSTLPARSQANTTTPPTTVSISQR
jgi:hypothetical protein